MQRVELLSHIEEQLGGNVEESQLAEIYTVRDLVDAVLQSAASGASGPGTRTAFAGWKAPGYHQAAGTARKLRLGRRWQIALHDG